MSLYGTNDPRFLETKSKKPSEILLWTRNNKFLEKAMQECGRQIESEIRKVCVLKGEGKLSLIELENKKVKDCTITELLEAVRSKI